MVLRKSHRVQASCPIPASISPAAVLRALYDHPTVFAQKATITNYEVIPSLSLPQSVRDDCRWFSGDHDGPNNIVAYEISEAVPLVPGVESSWATMGIKFYVRCQNMEDGIRCQANAPAGVTVRSTYRVIDRAANNSAAIAGKSKRNSVAKSSGVNLESARLAVAGQKSIPDKVTSLRATEELDQDTDRAGAWDLVEDAVVECNIMMLPFVAANMDHAHNEMLNRILRDLESAHTTSIANGATHDIEPEQTSEKKPRPTSYVPSRH